MKKYILILVNGVFLLFPLVSHGQLLEVKQTVFGMDCAPCAYGLEKRIQNMDGVQSATVSLNEGLLVADLKESNQLTLKEIREAVENSGFQPKEAIITVAGKVTQGDDGAYVLETASQEHFVLTAEDKSVSDKISEAGQQYVITGRAEINESGDTRLWVLNI